MPAANTIKRPANKWINICCVVAALLAVFLYPVKHSIWYDESISVLCSKGITYDTKDHFPAAQPLSSSAIEACNNPAQVFHTTVMDNANSLLYNEGLHFFTLVCGNSLSSYILWSRLCAAAALIAFFCLAVMLMGDSIFVAAAVILYCTDMVFWSMANEVRAYSLGMLFVTLAAISLFKYTYKRTTPFNLFLFGLWSVCAMLSHFFTVYITGILAFALLYRHRASLLTGRNLAAMLLPVGLFVVYFICAIDGFMPKQVHTMILLSKTQERYSILQGMSLFAKHTAVNFKAIFPFLSVSPAVAFLSLGFIVVLFFYGLRLLVHDKNKKEQYLVLFALGISSSILLMLLSIKNQVYTPFYLRYFSFSIPFCCLFAALALKILWDHRGNKLVKIALAVILIIPPAGYWAMQLGKPAGNSYNHMAIAEKIISGHITKAEVPDWTDAFLIQSFLPGGYNIDYLQKPGIPVFKLYSVSDSVTIPITVKLAE